MSRIFDAYENWMATWWDQKQGRPEPEDIWEAATERALRAMRIVGDRVFAMPVSVETTAYLSGVNETLEEIRRLIEEDENL